VQGSDDKVSWQNNQPSLCFAQGQPLHILCLLACDLRLAHIFLFISNLNIIHEHIIKALSTAKSGSSGWFPLQNSSNTAALIASPSALW
jgi:hypothetical protein